MPKGVPIPRTPELLAKIRDARRAGLTWKLVGQRVGLPGVSMRKLGRDLGLVGTRGPNSLKAARPASLATAAMQAAGDAGIASLSRETIEPLPAGHRISWGALTAEPWPQHVSG